MDASGAAGGVKAGDSREAGGSGSWPAPLSALPECLVGGRLGDKWEGNSMAVIVVSQRHPESYLTPSSLMTGQLRVRRVFEVRNDFLVPPGQSTFKTNVLVSCRACPLPPTGIRLRICTEASNQLCNPRNWFRTLPCSRRSNSPTGRVELLSNFTAYIVAELLRLIPTAVQYWHQTW
jgi:hypothetical protein